MAFVHPAAVVPLTRWKHVDGAALILASIGADFEYFATLSGVQRAHPSPWWELLFGAAVGLALTALLDVVGPGLARALPRFLDDLVGDALRRRFRERGAVAVALGLVVGALSHALWDALAEHNGALHALVPWRAIATWSTPVGVVVIVASLALAQKPASKRAITSADARAQNSTRQAGAAPEATRRFAATLFVVVVAGVVGAVACAALREYVLGGSVRDVMAAASGGGIFGVALACARRPQNFSEPGAFKPT